MTNCKYLDDYIKQVKSGQYRVCKEQIQLVNFIEKVFENEQVYVDNEQVEKYFALQKYFPYELFAWEKFCFILHNCTYSAPGVLRFPDLVCVVGRGAGKMAILHLKILLCSRLSTAYAITILTFVQHQKSKQAQPLMTSTKFWKTILQKCSGILSGTKQRLQT